MLDREDIGTVNTNATCDNGGGSDPTPTVWINEFHYDNASGDEGEFVEVAGTAGVDLSTYSIVKYNGSNNQSYGEDSLEGTIPDEANGIGAVAIQYPANGLQNGAPDGIALVNGTECVQFISYEGAMTASGGACDGVASEEVVSQGGSTPVGSSVSLAGSGTKYADFTWENTDETATPGNANTNQTFGESAQ